MWGKNVEVNSVAKWHRNTPEGVVGCYKGSCFLSYGWVQGDGVVWVWVGVDRIVGEVVLYAHEVWNRGVKRLCGEMCWGCVKEGLEV